MVQQWIQVCVKAIARFRFRVGRVFSFGVLLTITALIIPAFSLEMQTSTQSKTQSTWVTSQLLQSQRSSAPKALELQATELYQAGRYDAAAQLWYQLANQFRQNGDRAGTAMAMSNLALCYEQLGQWQHASKAIAEGLAIFRATPPRTRQDTLIYAQALDVQGKLHFAKGYLDLALTSWEQSADIYKQLNEFSHFTQTLIRTAQVLQSMGRYKQAQKQLQTVQASIESEPDSLVSAIALQHLGTQLRNTGDLDRSHQVLQHSLAIAQQLKNLQAMSEAYLGLGNTARAQGMQLLAITDTKQAEQFFQDALRYYEQGSAIALSPDLAIQAQLNRFSLLVERQQYATATALQPQLHQQLQSLPTRLSTVYALVNYARTLLKLNQAHPTQSNKQLNDAEQALTLALSQVKVLGNLRAESYVLGNLGQIYRAQGNSAQALALTQQALLQAAHSQSSDSEYYWHWQMGQLLWAQGKRTDAIATYNQAIQILQDLRADLVAMNPNVQYSFREDVEPVYREFVDLLLQPAEPGQAHLQQARNIIELLQLAEVENFLRQACVVPSRSIDTVLDQQDATAAVIYPIILRDRLEVIVKLPQQAELLHYATSVTQAELEKTLDELQNLVIQPETAFVEQAKARSNQLYRWLIAPALDKFEQHHVTTLVFVLDGSLRNVPMAILHDGQQYLIERYSLALTPGLQLAEPKPLRAAALDALAGGISESRPDFSNPSATEVFSALPYVPIELNTIQSKISSQILLNENFTRKSFQTYLNEHTFSIVHLATHGQFSSQAETTFILAWDQVIHVNELNDLFRGREQQQLPAIELLVLSACQTASGDNRAALGIAGVTVKAGARSTIASLWNINDTSTALLMEQFYQAIAVQKLPKAEALRQAQLFLLHHENPEYRRPYKWSPYLLVGNWL